MKQIITILCFALLLAACNQNAPSTTGETAADVKTVPASNVALPYTLEKPYRNWQMGSTENAAAAMKCLKAFVDNDFTTLAATLGDSVDIAVDYFHQKLSKDSAVATFKKWRPAMTDLNITMYDYESVISEDKKDEWVTIWYKQKWKDEKGKADSINCIDDCKMKDGKMIELDEKIQHFLQRNNGAEKINSSYKYWSGCCARQSYKLFNPDSSTGSGLAV